LEELSETVANGKVYTKEFKDQECGAGGRYEEEDHDPNL